MRLIFYRLPNFDLSKKALLPRRVNRAFTMYYTITKNSCLTVKSHSAFFRWKNWGSSRV